MKPNQGAPDAERHVPWVRTAAAAVPMLIFAALLCVLCVLVILGLLLNPIYTWACAVAWSVLAVVQWPVLAGILLWAGYEWLRRPHEARHAGTSELASAPPRLWAL